MSLGPKLVSDAVLFSALLGIRETAYWTTGGTYASTQLFACAKSE
jgi:hypothetical protein